MWVWRATFYPQVGKVSEVRDVAVDLAKWFNEHGTRVVVTQVVWGPEANTIVGEEFFESLGDLEASRKARQEDPQFHSLVAKLAPLVRAPAKFDLLEVVISFPT